MAIKPEFTTILVFLVISSSSISISLPDAGYSSWRILSRALERSLKV